MYNRAITGQLEFVQYAVYKNQAGEVVDEIKDQAVKSRKILGNGQFMFITWQSSGEFKVAATGLYSLEKGFYLEQIEATSAAQLAGKNYRFSCELKYGIWHHSGMEDGILIEEHWQK